ncbi:MAG: PAS domain S-box protein [Gemmatimonadaceae bacterium]
MPTTSSISINQKASLGLAGGLLVFASVSLVAYRSTGTFIASAERVSHTHRVIETLGDARARLEQAEASQREFLITGDATRLPPYHAAARELRDDLRDLRRLTSDNADQQARLDVLDALVKARMAMLDGALDTPTVATRAGIRLAGDDRGRATSDSIRTVAMRMSADEHRLLTRRELAQAASVDATLTTIIAGVVLSLFVAVIAYAAIARDVATRRRTGLALQASEERFRSAFEHSGIGVAIAALEGRWMRVNPALSQMLGYDDQELVRRPFADFTHPDDRAADGVRIRHLIDDRVPTIEFDTRYVHRDGRIVVAHVNVSVVRDAAGAATHFISQIQDVTARTEAEQALHRREQEFKALAENAPDVIARYDRYMRCLYLNPAIEKATGSPPRAFIGKTHLDAGMSPSLVLHWNEAIRRVFETGDEVSVEIDFPTPDGIRVYRSRFAPERAATGEIDTVLAISHDITDRKRAEEALRESERKYRVVVEQASDGIALADAHGVIVDVNQRVSEIVGYSHGELVGRSLSDFVPPEEQAVQPIRFADLQTKRSIVVERTLRSKNGADILVELSASMLDDGRIQTVLRDVTVRRRAEQSVRESERRFREILETVRSVAVCLDVHGDVTFVNDSLLALTGWTRDEVVGRNWFETFVPARNEIGPTVFEAMTRGGILAHYESEILTRHGHRRLLSWDNTVLRNSAGQMIGTASLGQDVTDRRRAEEAQQRLTTILEATPDLVAIWTIEGQVLYLNRAGRRMLGIGDDEHGANFTIGALQPHWGRDVALGEAIRTVLRDGSWSGEITLVSRDGREVPVSQVILAHKSPNGSVEYFSTIMRDITERKQAEATLRTLSLYDELTHLCNRRGFMTLAEQELKVARRQKAPALLFYIDMNDFKSVNDNYGHAEGDAALVRAADVLKATFRESDVLARIGGDEFVVLVLNKTDETQEAVLARLRSRLAIANAMALRTYELSLSIGIAKFDPASPKSLEELMSEADVELYAEKRSRHETAGRS